MLVVTKWWRSLKLVLTEGNLPWRSEQPCNPCPRSQDPKDQGMTLIVEWKSMQWTFVVPGAWNFQMPRASNSVESALLHWTLFKCLGHFFGWCITKTQHWIPQVRLFFYHPLYCTVLLLQTGVGVLLLCLKLLA